MHSAQSSSTDFQQPFLTGSPALDTLTHSTSRHDTAAMKIGNPSQQNQQWKHFEHIALLHFSNFVCFASCMLAQL
jgi:hypothetical protein